MEPIEIIIIIAAIAIVAGVIVSAIVRKKKGKTGCDCGCSSCPHCVACRSAKERKAASKERK